MSVTASLLDVRFLLLLIALGLGRWLIPARHYLWFGVIGSSVAVAVAAPATFAVVVAVVLLWLFPLHRLTVAARVRGWPAWFRASLVPAGAALLVAILILAKANRYFTLPWFGSNSLVPQLATIVGLSYFLFRAISYLHIQSILRLDERTPWSVLFYALFPSTLTSGPIQKYQDFRAQLAQPAPLTSALLTEAGYRITRGYFRKVFLGFVLNAWAMRLLAQPQLNGGESLLVIAVLYFYFYFDFAGYSDIAIGLGLLMGIRVPENFRRPFTATTISEFWRNWHISLVDWFRDQVFIPLGGMRSSRARAGALALLVMVLCGLWHGLALPFVIWGLWHGTALLAEALLGTKPVPPAERQGFRYWARVGWTNLRVALPGILFLPNPADITRIAAGLTHWHL